MPKSRSEVLRASITEAGPPFARLSRRVGANLSRLLARDGLSLQEASRRTGVDERTIRGVLRGTNRPHARTLHRLASGLGVSVDEFYVDPSQLCQRRFDEQTNPIVREVVETHGSLFDGWTEADFDELLSRVGTGGALTLEGALAAVDLMNRKRDLHEKLDLLLESGQAELVARLLDVLYSQVVVVSR